MTQREKYKYVIKETDSVEIYALLGFMYARGMKNLNYFETRLLFDAGEAAIFAATFGHNRFAFLHSVLSFDDESTRQQRYQSDRFAAIRNVFEIFNEACMTVLIPETFLTIDETLFSSRHRVQFKQYNPSVRLLIPMFEAWKAIVSLKPFTTLQHTICSDQTLE